VDVGIVFGVYVLEFRMEGFIAGAGQAGIAFGDLDEGISFMEVGVVVIAWEPAGCGVGYFISLRGEGFVLNEAAEGFGIAEVFGTGEGWSYTCSQFLLVITTGKTIYLMDLWFSASLSTYSSCNSIQRPRFT
jgi:hypothetical protein